MTEHKIHIRGAMVPNDYAEFFDYIGAEYTCPRIVTEALDKAAPGDRITVYINSGGGVIDVGSEIYTALRAAAKGHDLKIYITGQACSAASVVACAGYCEMAPTALMMVHCVSSGVSGNHSDMEHMAEVLSTADKALCTAYMAKAGMTQAEALDMMEHETWLTAEQAQEKGLIDGIMFDSDKDNVPLVAGSAFQLPTKEQLAQVHELIKGKAAAGDTPHRIEVLKCKAAGMQRKGH